MDNIQNVSKLNPYNLEALKRILIDTSQQTADKKPPNDDSPVPMKNEWRLEPFSTASSDYKREVMIISSYGDEMFPDAVVVEKIQDNSTSDKSKLQLVRQELDILQDVFRKAEVYSLIYMCTDFPGAQFTKKYYIDRIKQFFSMCELEGAVLFYTGHGEKDTGNWCFKDGVITFEEIFGLYLDVMKGKPLYIISDCSSAGKWAECCAAKLDEIGILSCGHHTREQGILLKVIGGCTRNENSTICTYSKKLVSINEKHKMFITYPINQNLESGQATVYVDYFVIRCNKKYGEQCQVVSSDHTWMDRLFHGHLVYCVRGKDKGKPAWHYVLVDEEKEAAFKEKVKTGNVDVAEYGKVLKSGWGEDPPQSVKNMISQKFNRYLPEED